MPKLSVIILSYNTKDITRVCLEKLVKSLSTTSFQSEIIVVDNASEDGSQDMIAEFKRKNSSTSISIRSMLNQQNEGFPKGNNQALHNASGQYILFLNSDVIIDKLDWDEFLKFADSSKDLGALTVRVELPTKNIDPASHRGFPTLWNSFCYFAQLERMTRRVPSLQKLFGGYHLTHLDLSKIHEIDSPSGAFYLSPKKVLDELSGFDETFFMYGEDLDLSFRIKALGLKILYYPNETVTHLKYQSGLKNKQAQKRTKKYFYDSMLIFYKKHYAGKYPWIIDQMVFFLIRLKSSL
ncbi:glycosyl transferase family 2 [Candidatus Roizmanbacteria bacterium CG_4_10_14_0_2_um_filter_39_13]|uniref:Glycosyl transferase family 2 n=1 Tax=Candidatus Roizmanbacteria bacterium CG_4_10_14_0_2_um_filter_39_13 TaxID=1974825 RepID=A0A2M7TWA5_9BACT|nr:MAG: glycosyl transferase family 2 [Candidatus Roizmanbacteria bacterium CG_4_10_14_0_2_um_filter_39_13]